MSAAKEKEKKQKKAEKEAEREKAPLKVAAPKKEKEDKNAPPPRGDRIDIVKARINKAFNGKGAVLSGDEFYNTFMLRRPTGITDLDLSIGGGWPAGGLSQLIGEDNAGKTYLADRTMLETQVIYGPEAAIAACMTESKFDKRFAKEKVGVQIAFSKLELEMMDEARARFGLPMLTDENKAWYRHQIGHFQEAVFSTAEQVLEAAVQLIEENVFQIVLIDSFGALLTAAEAESKEGLEGRHYGGASGVITQFMHRLHSALNLPDKYGRPNTTTVLGINQYRENLKAGGSQYADPLQIAGGRALKHGKLVDVLLKKGPKIRTGPNKELVVGKEIHWSVIKGKAGCHDGGSGTYRFYYGEHGYGFGADIYHNLLMAGVQSGAVEQSGAWYSFQGERICQGQDNAAYAFMQNPALVQRVRDAVFVANKLDFIVRETF